MGQFQLPDTDINLQSYKVDPIMLVDEFSSTDIYIGISKNGGDISRLNWRIKRIWQDGTVWKFEFPNGSQEFKFAWDKRFDYIYST